MMILAVIGEIIAVFAVVAAAPYASRRLRCLARARPAGPAPPPAEGGGTPGPEPFGWDNGVRTGPPPP
jgi:hypothetical protein